MFDGGRAVVEMAESAGHVEDGARDVMAAGTVGVGYAIHAALDLGARHVTVAAGGTGTVDGGIGALRALGARLLADDGSELDGTRRGAAAAGRDRRLRARPAPARVAADRRRRLRPALRARRGGAGVRAAEGRGPRPGRGARGGAEPAGGDPRHRPGDAGARRGGRLPGAVRRPRRRRGRLRRRLGPRGRRFRRRACRRAPLHHRRGRVDRQTALGKTVAGVVEAGTAAGVPVVVVGGTVEPEGAEALYDLGAAGVFGLLGQPSSLSEAKMTAEADLERSGRAISAFFAHFERVNQRKPTNGDGSGPPNADPTWDVGHSDKDLP